MKVNFTLSKIPFSDQSHIHRLHIGYGKIYYINKNNIPYLEIEISDDSKNPFDMVFLFGNYFCIGQGNKAYFIDLLTYGVKELDFDWYFAYFYEYNGALYIASDSRLFRLDSKCNFIWKSDKIAIDGVIVDRFSEDVIYVSCEMDPPGGWITRNLSVSSGQEIEDIKDLSV